MKINNEMGNNIPRYLKQTESSSAKIKDQKQLTQAKLFSNSINPTPPSIKGKKVKYSSPVPAKGKEEIISQSPKEVQSDKKTSTRIIDRKLYQDTMLDLVVLSRFPRTSQEFLKKTAEGLEKRGFSLPSTEEIDRKQLGEKLMEWIAADLIPCLDDIHECLEKNPAVACLKDSLAKKMKINGPIMHAEILLKSFAKDRLIFYSEASETIDKAKQLYKDFIVTK